MATAFPAEEDADTHSLLDAQEESRCKKAFLHVLPMTCDRRSFPPSAAIADAREKGARRPPFALVNCQDQAARACISQARAERAKGQSA
ncbi:hypothetical protein PB2503_12649 [Parvularcula bermudensis HTCC2503]|uniref:Uncharacterized protein n=1 Tax=Parvularcula bermudensis (strain ATCC BAA-594 / HTCC2503 / KCTC 12087) TaxID=314260 RepID=E0TFK7_PARBH|nr:hypothetical protein PB2503_12649 [Parvularcula bermudensis HTCC2503]